MSHSERRRGRLRLSIGVAVIVVVSASTAVLSGPAASPLTPRLAATRASSAAGYSPAASVADQVTPETGGPCPPNPTYPDSPTDHTQYGVPFTADILDGTVSVGYNEDSGGPGTLAHPNMPWFPWLLHVTGLRGTVSGCVPLPGLSLEVQPSNLHVNTYGYMTEGTDNCANLPSVCSVGAHSSATFDFTGIADPGQTNLPVFFAGQDNGANAGGAATLHYQTTPAAGLEVGTPVFTEQYPYPGTGPVKPVNLAAGSPPGAKLKADIYGGSVTVTNTTASTVTSITGEESAGFISGPSTLAPFGSPGGTDTGTYTFTFEGSSFGELPEEQELPLNFSGQGPAGLVEGSGIAYFTFPQQNVTSLSISKATICVSTTCSSALTAPGPPVPMGSVFSGTVTLTNNTDDAVTGIFGETGEEVQLLATLGTSGFPSPPLVLGQFNLSVAATKALAAKVVGARPDSFGATPFGALDSTATASAIGTLSAANPPLVCSAPVSTMVTTGSSTMVPKSPAGDPPHAAGPQWTVQGEPISGALAGATARLVSNSFPLQLPPDPTCGINGAFTGVFNTEIGGVEPNGDFYNCPSSSTCVPAGAASGEVQIEIDVMLTSVGGLPVCRPTRTAPVACGG
jgi:hypothetical protein